MASDPTPNDEVEEVTNERIDNTIVTNLVSAIVNKISSMISGKEDKSNKVTNWSNTVSDTNYPSEKLVKDNLDNKQTTLVSGTNIKTINNNSILGSGNISIQGGGGVEVGTFTDLQTLITNVSDGDTIILDKDYKYNATTDTNLINGINLKRITINGNGHIIDGNNSASIFYIVDTGMVKLNNLILQNCNPTEKDGGAIFIDEQDSVIINNITFINNCSDYGGGIFIGGSWNNIVDINNCTFINNRSSLGGAIYSFGSDGSYKNTININNSTFISNVSAYCGSAILGYYLNDININNCIFEENICIQENGDGCIYYTNENTSSVLVIKNSSFRNNSGDTYNNIYSNIPTKVYNCEIDNISTTCYNITNYVSINNDMIVDNLVTNDSIKVLSAKQGKVLSEGKQDTLVSGTNIKTINNVSILGSGNVEINYENYGTFTELQEEIDSLNGGDKLYLWKDYFYNFEEGDSSHITIENKNISIVGNGHIISGAETSPFFSIIDSKVNLYDLKFENSYTDTNGCITVNGVEAISNLNIYNCSFKNNYNENDPVDDAGIILIYNSNVYINNSSFIDNLDTKVIQNVSGNLVIKNSLFADNITDFSNNSIIYLNSDTTNSIVNCTFRDNHLADGETNIFIIYSGDDLIVYNCEIDDIANTCYNVINYNYATMDTIGDAITYINVGNAINYIVGSDGE